MVTRQAPGLGDIVWVNFSPQVGRETAGNRPGLVLTPADYNQKIGRALVCPITSQPHQYPFMVPLPQGCPVQGWVITDQLKTVDWRARSTRFIAKAPAEVLDEVRHWLRELLQLG